MRLLFLGDIVGRPGRRVLRELLTEVKRAHAIDIVVANGENAAGGAGITPETAAEIFNAGVDLITSGDHLWDQKEVKALLADEPRFIRPGNYPPHTPGQGAAIYQAPGLPPIGVVNLQGRTFMPPLDNPFPKATESVQSIQAVTPIILVDFHAEATAEKIALGRMLDGKVSLVVGTHTHCQTGDEQIFPGGTAFLCDAGFTGPHESVLGRKIDPVIQRFLTYQPQRFEVASKKILLQGVVTEIDRSTGKAERIFRISEPLPNTCP